MRRKSTRNTEIEASYEKLYDFLIDLNNMPRWAVFAKRIWREGDTVKAETPQGEAELWTECSQDAGKITYHWKIGDAEDFAETRLYKSNGHLVYEFTIQEPPEAPQGMFDELVSKVDEELESLKKIAEAELR